MRKLGATVLFAALLAGAPAWAGSILELPINDGGIVWLQAGTRHHRADGAGIKINELVFGADTLSVLNGMMSFTTGNSISASGGNFSFGPGGKITVSGCVSLDGAAQCDKNDFRGVLISGTFLGTKILKEQGEWIMVAQFVEQLNPELAALLKLPDSEMKGILELQVTRAKGRPYWPHPVDGGYLEVSSLPEPTSIWLLGTMVAIFAGMRRGAAMVRKRFLQP